jgi:hypothetical protein
MPVYSAVFLTSESKLALLKAFPAIHPKVFAHHVTLMFKPSSEHLASLEVGRRVDVEVCGYAEDVYGQAVVVRLPDDVNCDNDNPHITISVADGRAPKYSNQLLSLGYAKIASFLLEGIIGTA